MKNKLLRNMLVPSLSKQPKTKLPEWDETPIKQLFIRFMSLIIFFSKYEIIQGEFNYYDKCFGPVFKLYKRVFLVHEKMIGFLQF